MSILVPETAPVPDSAHFVAEAHIYTVMGYVVTTNSDRSEGRGHTICMGVFESRQEAAAAAYGRGVAGASANIGVSQDIRLLITKGNPRIFMLDFPASVEFYPTGTYDPERLQQARESALKKLTTEDRIVLGLM